ncbi:hypothetical protein TrRE_jg9053, partial [Triparma retinervis]
MGASGIISPLITEPMALTRGQDSWKITFVATMMIVTKFVNLLFPSLIHVTPLNYWMNAVAGLLVGFGTFMSNGCTSGHGICGLGRFSIRSLASVCTFVATGVITATIISLATDPQDLVAADDADLISSSKTVSDIFTFVLAGVAVTTVGSTSNPKQPSIFPVIISGLLFSLGLIVSGMSNPEVVLGFLDVNVGAFKDWNATLCFVMACGVSVSVATYQYRKRRARGDEASCPPQGCGISIPAEKSSGNHGNQKEAPPTPVMDFKLIGGSVLFGIGWGLAGICPGPMIVGI